MVHADTSKSGKSYRKAGHRSWAPRGGLVPGKYNGDIMSVDKRSKVMSRIKGKDTTPERIIFASLEEKSIKFEKHCRDLPGSPDVVLRNEKVAIFLDGNFWHGWRFPLWEHKLSDKWRNKIAATRKRDQKNFRKLRNQNWKVLRLLDLI